MRTGEEVAEDGSGPCESTEKTSRWHRLQAEFEEAAAGKKESFSLPLGMDMNNREVEKELSTRATLAWAEE